MRTPLVGVIMGSDSDWAVLSAAAEVLTEFGVPHEARVVSAHRAPRDMLEYAVTAADRGLRVIVAGAGGAAHLPGMVASLTPLPVVGVPVPLAHLDGMDSLLSIVQMPVSRWQRSRWRAPATPPCSPCASSAPPTRGCAPGWWPTSRSWPPPPEPRTQRCKPKGPAAEPRDLDRAGRQRGCRRRIWAGRGRPAQIPPSCRPTASGSRPQR